MRFVIGGKSHELNYETVLEAASQIEPEILDGRHNSRHRWLTPCSNNWDNKFR